MATYSRSQTTTQTSQSSVMPSMDIGTLLVKTMENVMNDKQDNKGFEDSISNGINNSDLLKDKTKTDTDKELVELLKDKKNSDKELSNLLKDTNKNSKESKKDSSMGKIVSGGVIAATVGSILKSKSLGGVVGGVGKAAGGLLSGVGNIGGSAIAGVGKLFGPVGAIVGKAVGAAVAAPFKIVGGTITAAIGGLGKLLSMPLKEMLTKGTLIVGVLSQLFVFLEGLMAKFIAEKDIKWIDFMSKLKSNIAIIPDKIKLSLEQVLSKVRIMGKPIFGAMSKDEEKQLKNLEKDKDIKAYNKAMKGVDEADRTLNTMASQMGAVGINATDYNLDTEEGRKAYKAAVIAAGKKSSIENGMPELNEEYASAELDKWLANRDRERAAAEEKVKSLKIDNEKLSTYLDLKDRSKQALTQDYFDKQQEALEEKQKDLYDKEFAERLYDYSQDKGGLTQYQQDYANRLHAGSVARVQGMYAASDSELTTRDATGAERFLQNQYKQWTDAWGKMFKDFKQDIGINITQKQEIPNPSFGNR